MTLETIKEKDHKGLFLKLSSDYPLTEPLWFYRECASVIETRLLEQHVDKILWGRLEEIRKVSYARGWRDAKSKKRRKETDFDSSFDIGDWERVQP